MGYAFDNTTSILDNHTYTYSNTKHSIFDIENFNASNALTRTCAKTIDNKYLVNLKIGTCNIAGLERNGDYVNELSMITDVLLITETWHSKHQEVDESIKLLNKTTRSKAGLKINKKGRNPG